MAPEIVRGGQIGHDFSGMSLSRSLPYCHFLLIAGCFPFLSVDWWSFGVLIYELLTGASPFTVEGEKNTQQEISRRILRTNPPIPQNLSPEVVDLLNCVLVKDPRKRLGSVSADDIKRHPFFKTINWDDLAARRVPAPFKPKILSELDVSNFAEEFTSMVPKVSLLMADTNNNPNSKQTNAQGGNQADQATGNDDTVVVDDDLFRGYSYVAPSVVLDDGLVFAQKSSPFGGVSPNVTTNNCPANGNTTSKTRLKPDIAKLIATQKSGSDRNEFFKNYQLMPGTDDAASLFDDYDWLGDGSFSVCCRCVHKQTGAEYAVKILSRHRRRDSVTDTFLDASRKEEQLLRACQGHPGIVTLKEVIQDESHHYIVMGLLRGGELLSRIRKRGRFTEAEAWTVFRQLVSAVAYLHSKGIVHRDIKPEVSSPFNSDSALSKQNISLQNVLFCDSTDKNIRIVDFGFARFYTAANGDLMQTPCCTLNYAAPEVLYQAILKSSLAPTLLKKDSGVNRYNPAGYDTSCDVSILYRLLLLPILTRPLCLF